MKTLIVLFIASLLLLATFQAHAEVGLVKNRRLLSDKDSATNKGWEQAKNIDDDDDETSSPEQSTHHYWPDQDPKPGPKSSTSPENMKP